MLYEFVTFLCYIDSFCAMFYHVESHFYFTVLLILLVDLPCVCKAPDFLTKHLFYLIAALDIYKRDFKINIEMLDKETLHPFNDPEALVFKINC